MQSIGGLTTDAFCLAHVKLSQASNETLNWAITAKLRGNVAKVRSELQENSKEWLGGKAMPVFWILLFIVVIVIWIAIFPLFGKIGNKFSEHMNAQNDKKKERKRNGKEQRSN